MYYFFTWTTGQTEVDSLLHQAVSRWEQLAVHTDLTSADELDALLPERSQPDAGIPPHWASTYYLLSHPEQVFLAFAWLHWWQQSTVEEPGFAGWLLHGPGFSLNHASLLKVLTQDCEGVLGLLHGFLEAIPEVVSLLTTLDTEYRYTIHDRELWPAVLHFTQAR